MLRKLITRNAKQKSTLVTYKRHDDDTEVFSCYKQCLIMAAMEIEYDKLGDLGLGDILSVHGDTGHTGLQSHQKDPKHLWKSYRHLHSGIKIHQ